MLVILLLSVLMHVINAQRGTITCSNTYECQNKKIESNIIDCNGFGGCDSAEIRSKGQMGHVACTAHKACNEATALQAYRNLICQGSYSCFGTANLKAKVLECSAAYACKHETILDAENLVYCGGFQACPQSVIESGREIHCDGVQSCIEGTLQSGDLINCFGNKACQISKLTAKNLVKCSGNQACKRGKITATKVQFHGSGSGQNVKVSAEVVEAYGYNAISSTEISAKRNSTRLKVRTSGEAVGKDTTVVCNSGIECDVECSDNCASLEVLSYEGSTVNVKVGETECTATSTEEGCPKRRSSSSACEDRELDAYLKNKREIIETRMLSEDDSDYRGIDFFSGDADGDYHALDAMEAIEADVRDCLVEGQCQNEVIENVDAQCYGYEACAGSQYNSSDPLSTIGSFGEGANFGGIINTKGTVQCEALEACAATKYFAGKQVECAGRESCAYSKNGITATAINCMGTKSCAENQLKISVNAKCLANRACLSSNITAGKGILCDGHYSCSDSELKAVGAVKCSGYAGCIGAGIESAQYVYVDGEAGATSARIRAPGVKVTGFKGMTGGTIDSGKNATLSVKLFGDMSGADGTVICERGSKCKVTCQSSGCKNMDYICFDGAAECGISPRECGQPRAPRKVESIDCPNMYVSGSKHEDQKLRDYMQQRAMDRLEDEEFVNFMQSLEFEEDDDGHMIFADAVMVQEVVRSDRMDNVWSKKLVSWDVVVGSVLLVIAALVLYLGFNHLRSKNGDIVHYQYLK